MTPRLRTRVLAAVLALAGGLGGVTGSALAQGPYGRNTYQDFPYNQGSLFYRPLKPNDPPRRTFRAPRRAPGAVAPGRPRGAPSYYQPRPGWYPAPQGYYSYPQGSGYY